MRFHTDLSLAAIHWIRAHCGAPNIRFERCEMHGSRTHRRAFDILLGGSGGRNNTGQYGAGDYEGATWDEWGAFMGMVFAFDPNARLGGTQKHPVYANAEDFHRKTGHRFTGLGVPEDTHSRHRWIYDGGDGVSCSRCTASRTWAFAA